MMQVRSVRGFCQKCHRKKECRGYRDLELDLCGGCRYKLDEVLDFFEWVGWGLQKMEPIEPFEGTVMAAPVAPAVDAKGPKTASK